MGAPGGSDQYVNVVALNGDLLNPNKKLCSIFVDNFLNWSEVSG